MIQKKTKKNFFKLWEYSGSCRSTAWRSQPPLESRPKIKHNNIPLANASEKRRPQTNALKTKLKIVSNTQS
jgi:hypothetical protein